jgi:ATP-dependent helicase/nuclease subunit A
VVDALAQEQAERRREELNGLYVALTRAQTTLVISSLEPHIKNAGSWWQRLEALATEVQWSGEVATLPAAPVLPAASVTLKILPNVSLAPVECAQSAIKKVAITGGDGQVPGAVDSLESRIGQAMHRLLQWVEPLPAGVNDSPWTVAQCDRVAVEFALDTSQLQQAQGMAVAILRGKGAWAWDTTQLAWAANEVPITQGGRMLYMDRLVQNASTQEWWILDYKSSASPLEQPELLAQLAGYRAAVAKAYPGQTVRAAFLTAQGALLEPIY